MGDGRISASGATGLSCGAAVRSSGGASVTYSFVDNGPSDLQIAEIDASGSRVPYATVVPGAVLTVSTAVGDYWVVENAGGGCLAVFGINGSGRVVVT